MNAVTIRLTLPAHVVEELRASGDIHGEIAAAIVERLRKHAAGRPAVNVPEVEQAEIRERRELGWSICDLSRHFHRGRPTIQRVLEVQR